MTRNSAKLDEREQAGFKAGPGPDKFRILGQLQLSGNGGRHFLGLGGFDLAFDGRILDRAVFRGHLGLRPRHPLGVDDHVRLRGISLRADSNVGHADEHREGGDQRNEAPLPGQEIANLKERQTSRTGVVVRSPGISRKLPGHVHTQYLEPTVILAISLHLRRSFSASR